jgi:hypothetical protein
MMTRSFYGATHFFDNIGEMTGVADDLKNASLIVIGRSCPSPIT